MNEKTSILTFILTSFMCIAFAEPYCKTLASVNMSPDQSRRGHLNFDIGGATPKTLKTKDNVSDGARPSRGKKRLKSSIE